MTFRWETECELCKENKAIQYIINKLPYCDECHAKIGAKR